MVLTNFCCFLYLEHFDLKFPHFQFSRVTERRFLDVWFLGVWLPSVNTRPSRGTRGVWFSSRASAEWFLWSAVPYTGEACRRGEGPSSSRTGGSCVSVPLCPVVTRNYITIQVSPPWVLSCAFCAARSHEQTCHCRHGRDTALPSSPSPHPAPPPRVCPHFKDVA